MNSLPFTFEIQEPEHPNALVPNSQIVVFNLDIKTTKVVVYFMENSAMEIEEGKVNSGMGTITLGYTAHSPSGAITASNSIRKVAYTFTDAQGLARNFEFKGRQNQSAQVNPCNPLENPRTT